MQTAEPSVPIGEDLLGFLHFILGTGKVELHFPGSASDDHFDRRQTAPLHPQVELFVGFVNSVALETVHGSASAPQLPNAMTNTKYRAFGGCAWHPDT
jgi:hypothetical protein